MAEVTRNDIKLIWNVMQIVGEKPASKRFSLGLTKNKRRMKEELEVIKETEKGLTDFEDKRLQLCGKYVARHPDGTPIIENNEYKGVASSPAFRIDLAELRKKYEKDITEVSEIMNEKIEIDFYQITYKDVPDIIKPGEYDALDVMITDPEEEQREITRLTAENISLKKKGIDLEAKIPKSKE